MKKIKLFVRNERDRKKHLLDKIITVNDLMLFKKQHTLVIPSSHSRRLYNESELPYLSETIIRKGNTSSLHFDTDMPHTSMFVLPEPPSSSTEMKKVIEWSSRTSTKDVEPWKTTVAFSSLSLLRTICDCSKYKMEVVCCIDGTHGIMCNDYKLLIFGVLDFIRNPKKGKKKVSRQFKPLLFIVAKGETMQSTLLALSSFKYAVDNLFGIEDIQFRGGCISDFSESFFKSFEVAFNKSPIGTCFVHII